MSFALRNISSRVVRSLRTATKKAFVAHPKPVNSGFDGIFACTYLRNHSASARMEVVVDDDDDDNNNNNNNNGPWGDLFQADTDDLLGKSAWINRTFDPRSNSQAMLTCGGEDLAKHASFDPSYDRARSWIRHHAVGPAVLSPVLIGGLVGALVEAALPHAVPVSCSMQQIRPLIVGVEVRARITVKEVKEEVPSLTTDGGNGGQHKKGFAVELHTQVTRLRDHATIAEGNHLVWVPDYLHM